MVVVVVVVGGGFGGWSCGFAQIGDGFGGDRRG